MGTNASRFVKSIGIALVTVIALALVAPATNVAGGSLLGPTEVLADPGTAYAVLDSEGTLTFIRSTETVANGTSGTITDIDGEQHVGTIYTGFETAAYGYPDVPWYSQRSSIASVFFKDEIKPNSTANWFYGCSNMTSATNLSNLDTSNVTDMDEMFYGCSSLASLDVSNWDTSKVTDTVGMFYGCSSLTSLDVSNWDTSNVTDMGGMFYGCSSLTSLDVSNWDTSNVKAMDGMFRGCSSLTSLDVSNWDTSNVTTTYNMFSGCSSLASLDVSGFDTSKVNNTHGMFAGCSSLDSLDVTNFDTSNVLTMSLMFSDCSGLTSLDLSGFDMRNVGCSSSLVYGCSSLRTVKLGENVRFEDTSEGYHGWTLPTPTGGYYTGNWVKQGTSPAVVKSAMRLHNEYDTNYSALSGTWVAEQGGKLLVSADAEGGGTGTSFLFTLSLGTTGEYAYTITDASGATVRTGMISDGGTFALADGQTFSAMLSDGATYTVTPRTLPDGWTKTSPDGDSATGTIAVGEDSTAAFSFRSASAGDESTPTAVPKTGDVSTPKAIPRAGDTSTPKAVPKTGDSTAGGTGAALAALVALGAGLVLRLRREA